MNVVQPIIVILYEIGSALHIILYVTDLLMLVRDGLKNSIIFLVAASMHDTEVVIVSLSYFIC